MIGRIEYNPDRCPLLEDGCEGVVPRFGNEPTPFDVFDTKEFAHVRDYLLDGSL